MPHINSIISNEETHWMIPYFQRGWDEAKMYIPTSVFEINPICPQCGRIKSKSMPIHRLYINHSIGCPCGDGVSYPEKFMFNILEQLNVVFQVEYSPPYLKLNRFQKRSDFFIPNKKLIIEADGGIGHKKGKMHGYSKKTLEECVEIDNWKDEQHKLHGLHTIRINCFKSDMKYIKNNILNSELVNYFNFESIDWNKANEFAWFSNLKKDVCEYWNNKEEWETTTELSLKFKLDKVTIRNYLNQGNNIWSWCNYDGCEERRKQGKLKSKKIEIFKDGISFGVFPSCAELERQSEELFGVKLTATDIGAVARGCRKTHGGFTFKYVDIFQNNKTKRKGDLIAE